VEPLVQVYHEATVSGTLATPLNYMK
jgi:hypothetical protein